MARAYLLPPDEPPTADGSVVGGWWRDLPDSDRILCELCPRACQLKPGDRGFCFVRQNVDGRLLLTTYGKSTGFCIDPIEKKPLNHFYPGTSVLSFGTAGCNLGCKFCQNWDISKSREVERLSERATPEMIAAAAARMGCRSVAYTYNDPVIWAEYAIDCARACRERGVQSVAVTAGYIMPQAREPFFREMDAANVDLKAFTEDFYYRITYSHLQPVLETLEWLHRESDVWVEITNLIIPDANDQPDDIRRMCDWILQHVGPDVPVHFTAFHPDFRMRDRGRTPHETLLKAYQIAREQGLHFVYVGNVNDVEHQSTYCPDCGQLLIERDWHQLGTFRLRGNRCDACSARIPGRFDEHPGDWGRRRLPVRIARFDSSPVEDPSTGDAPMTETPSSPAGAPTDLFQLSSPQREGLLDAVCRTVAAQISERALELPDPELGGLREVPVAGAFVTLKRGGHLRGCCGTLGRQYPLWQAVEHAARRTATEDPRLPPVVGRELPHLDVDISLLHDFSEITQTAEDRVRAIQVGRHGITIQHGQAGGLLLPKVATEQDMEAREFLEAVSRKAGLPRDAWRDAQAQIQTFEAVVIEGRFLPEVALPAAGHPCAWISHDEFQALVVHARQNVAALLQGATPNYYLPGGADGSVQGAAMSVRHEGRALGTLVQTALRPGLPLQATLFSLCQQAAGLLEQHGLRGASPEHLHIEVVAWEHVAVHGTLDDRDLQGFDPTCHGWIAMSQGTTTGVWHRGEEPEPSLERLLGRLGSVPARQTALYSAVFHASTADGMVSTVPQPRSQIGPRKPAVAGMFYPGDAEEVARQAAELLAASPQNPGAFAAALVPHAGWQYSGAIAARVLNRLTFPETVIVIGPKHTRAGVPYAVAPCDAWEWPGGSLVADRELATTLAERIDVLELDAEAHAAEHGIEVELPLIGQLAPSTRVVGIALGPGDLAMCERFAEQLADVLRGLPSPPLLLISSDMHHFGTDEENRRRDRMALDAMQTLDPARLYRTVTENGITMCGVLPAVIVMSTLRRLERLHACEEVAYGTSADTTGDTSRVVGYAGLLLA